MPADMATPSVQSLIDRFERLAARAEAPELQPARRRRRARCQSDAAAFAAIERDDPRLRRNFAAKRSVDMTSTTSTTSISSDDEGDEDDEPEVEVEVEVGVEVEVEVEVDCEVPNQQIEEQPSADVECSAAASDLPQKLEPTIVPVALPPIEEAASERASDLSQPASPSREDGAHGASCGCIVCWLRGSDSAETAEHEQETRAPHDEPLTLADLCTKHKAPAAGLRASPALLARAAARPSLIPRPSASLSLSAARRESLAGSSRRESLAGSAIPAPRAARKPATGVATDQRPRYMDYAQSPRFAALKAQNQERRRLAEQRSAQAKPRPGASSSSGLFSVPGSGSSSGSGSGPKPPRGSLAGASSASPCSSTATASLASSLPLRAQRPRHARSIST